MCVRESCLCTGREELYWINLGAGSPNEYLDIRDAIDRNREAVTGGLKNMYNEELRGADLRS